MIKILGWFHTLVASTEDLVLLELLDLPEDRETIVVLRIRHFTIPVLSQYYKEERTEMQSSSISLNLSQSERSQKNKVSSHFLSARLNVRFWSASPSGKFLKKNPNPTSISLEDEDEDSETRSNNGYECGRY